MFKPKPVRHGFGSYSPAFSEETMKVHYDKHYVVYIDNLNDAIGKTCPDFFKLEIPEILERIDEVPEEVRDFVKSNAGGAINHEILWDTLSDKPTTIHEGKFKEDICKEFQTWDKFLEAIVNARIKLLGSGWIWLVWDRQAQKFLIKIYPNLDSPCMDGMYPIFGIDMWEHSYYLQYKSSRKDYLANLLKIVDWKAVEQRYLDALK